MIPFTTALIHGLIICIPFSIFVLITFKVNPRLWLHSLPLDIQKRAAPKTSNEKKLTQFVLLPIYLLILPGFSIVSVVYSAYAMQINVTFLGAFVHLYIIWIVVHAWDLIVIDFGYTFFLNPQTPPIKGTEGVSGWKNYRFHFNSFVKAILMSGIFIVPAAFVISLLI